MCQRINLDPRAIKLELLEVTARRALIAFAPSDPGLETVQRALQRLGFAQGAACIRVAAMQQTVGVAQEHLIAIRADDAQIGQPKLRGHIPLISQRFGEQHFGVDEQNRRAAIQLRHHMQQRDRLCSKGTDQRNRPQHRIVQTVAQHGFGSAFMRWYAEYATLDDFGAGLEDVSAWAGLHYFAAGSSGFEFIGAHSVSPVDETAAGDAFTGYLLAGLSMGSDFRSALELASAAGALAVTAAGAASSIPDRSAVDKFIADN